MKDKRVYGLSQYQQEQILLLADTLSVARLSKQLNIPRHRVRYLLKKYKIKPLKSHIMWDDIYHDFKYNNMSVAQLVIKYKVSKSAIYQKIQQKNNIDSKK